MAAFTTRLVNHILKWEGGYSNVKDDKGGATNKGITWATYSALSKKVLNKEPTTANFKAITDTEAKAFIEYYFIAAQGPKINSQAIAELLTDMYWGGPYSIAYADWSLNQKYDSTLIPVPYVSDRMVALINSKPEKEVYQIINQARLDHYAAIVKNNPSQKKFYQGWLNRAADLVSKHKTLFASTAVALTIFLLTTIYFVTNANPNKL